MLGYRTILHATDFSAASMYAFGLARALARDSGAELLVAHVAPAGRHRGRAGAALRRLTAEDPAVRMYPLVLTGDPASRIVSSADQLDCDLIVMGTAGRTGLGRVLTGSVSAAVRRNARCPVLSVRLPAKGAWELLGAAGQTSAGSARCASPLAA